MTENTVATAPHKINQLRRLKVIRERSGASQEELAKYLKTTQQSIGRWENGQSEPSLAQLRDMAIYFGCSVDGLLGKIPGYGIESARYDVHRSLDQHRRESTESFTDPNFTGFWGHIGVLLPGLPHTRWYPITTQEYDRVSSRVFNADNDAAWVTCSTLSNRELVINTQNVDRIWFLDDNADQPDEDWEYIEEPQALELFIAVEAMLSDAEYDASEELTAAVKAFFEAHSEELEDLLYHTKIYFGDGRAPTKFFTDESSISYFAMSAADNTLTMDSPHKMIHFIEGSDHLWDSYIPQQKIAMVEIPLIRANEGWKKNWEEECPPVGSAEDLAMHAEWEAEDRARQAATRKPPARRSGRRRILKPRTPKE